jgi:hypothetical protein
VLWCARKDIWETQYGDQTAEGGLAYEGELPSQKVKRRPEIMGNLPNEYAPLIRETGRPTLNAETITSSFSIELGNDNTVGIVFEQPLKGCLQGYDLALCPLDLNSWPIQRVHVLYSNHEREEDAKDTKGSRDTHTKPRGLSKEPRPSGENPQETITASTLSEPKLETERDHPRGDYTAKHTHIDSLEDA